MKFKFGDVVRVTKPRFYEGVYGYVCGLDLDQDNYYEVLLELTKGKTITRWFLEEELELPNEE